MSNSLEPDQARRNVGPDLGPNCLPRLSADNTGRQRVNSIKVLNFRTPKMFAVITLKFKRRGLSIQKFVQKG